ncbi:MAG: pyridoxamine 5'-phosphate oxidase family protein [Chloroflexota bacterium]
MGGHIPWEKIDLRLKSSRSLWLATTRPDGRPHVVPVWFWWDSNGKRVYFVLNRAAEVTRNLANQQAVALHMGDGVDVVIIEGAARPANDAMERAAVNARWMNKYVDPFDGARAQVTGSDDILVAVQVEQVSAWEYGTPATCTEWKFNH